jgi:hypothetical protein
MNLLEKKHKYSTLVRRLAERLVRVRAARVAVVIVAATADVAADIAATRGDREGRGGRNVVVFGPAAGTAWSLP